VAYYLPKYEATNARTDRKANKVADQHVSDARTDRPANKVADQPVSDLHT